MFCGGLRAQHGHRGRLRAIATTIAQWTVAIELGTWRCGRNDSKFLIVPFLQGLKETGYIDGQT
jgi:hypothetical protein